MADIARRRHDLVRADPSAWGPMVAARADLCGLPWVADWAARGWPLIVRRADAADRAGEVALGLPLPPSAGKLRLSFALPAEALDPAEPPPLLADVAVPPAWRATRDALIACDARVRVFGALAWQAMTGLAYLGATSDIDLLWPAPPRDRIAALLSAIGAIEATAPMRLDGEIVRADGAAVNWRELAGRSDQVLVKQLDGVSLQSRSSFLEACA